MKNPLLHRIAPSLVVAVFVVTACSSTAPPPVGSSKVTYTKGVTGGVLLQTVKITATVTAMDPANRRATLLVSDGKKFNVKMGPGVINFEQLQVGDHVAATVTQKVVISPKGEETPSPGNSQGDPAAENVQLSGKVIAIDSGKRTVTLRFDDGVTQTLPVRNDVDLSRHKLGETFDFRVTEVTASWIEKTQ